jgi:hypothetical protein
VRQDKSDLSIHLKGDELVNWMFNM